MIGNLMVAGMTMMFAVYVVMSQAVCVGNDAQVVAVWTCFFASLTLVSASFFHDPAVWGVSSERTDREIMVNASDSSFTDGVDGFFLRLCFCFISILSISTSSRSNFGSVLSLPAWWQRHFVMEAMLKEKTVKEQKYKAGADVFSLFPVACDLFAGCWWFL